MKRVFLIVLDGVGAGYADDAESYGDVGANTIGHVVTDEDTLPNLKSMGLFNIDGLKSQYKGTPSPTAAYGRLRPLSAGKDTTTGHWELCGLVTDKRFPGFPDGFPPEFVAEMERVVGRKIIVNRPYSGTEVIKDYGREHMEKGSLIVYTSADSVLQIASHESVVPTEELYDICRSVRQIAVGKFAVARVIARPFTGTYPDFVRTDKRKDFSIAPPQDTLLDTLTKSGKEVIGVGKIKDIFAGKGVTRHIPTTGNTDGIQKLKQLTNEEFEGLCFVNLVDFDMHYGHRNDKDGFLTALKEFDHALPEICSSLTKGDMLIITADHGCDPTYKGTDHTRENVPLLVSTGGKSHGVNLGSLDGFTHVSELVSLWLLGSASQVFNTFKITSDSELIELALQARENAYCPYSGFAVGSAVLTSDGNVYTGCNIENSAYSPSCCAERVAIFKAISEGAKSIKKVVVVGGAKDKPLTDYVMPCGMCRQVLTEFATDSFTLISAKSPNDCKHFTFDDILPNAFKLER